MARANPHEHAVDRAARIFAVLRQAADRGAPCPEAATLAERFGCALPVVRRSLNFLEANGMIAIERHGTERVVTICASGHRTAAIAAIAVPQKERAEA